MTKRQTQWLLRILLGGGAGALLVLALWFQFRDPTGGGQSGVNAPRLR